MDIKHNGYPAFWSVIRKDFNKNRINKSLKCPMNYIFDIEVEKYRSSESTLPMKEFFIKYDIDLDRRKSKKVEELIQKYSLSLYEYNTDDEDEDNDDYLLLRQDFDELINNIRQVYISKNYLGIMSWLINRAFAFGAGVKSKQEIMQSTINTNKSLLLKVLYNVNSKVFLQCFSKEKVYND
jgi:hypothetical protein